MKIPLQFRSVLAAMSGAAALALPLGGCISLLPQSPPSQLYRFGADPGAEQTAAPAAGPGVVLAEVVLPVASAGDQILTVTGDRAAYIAQARWVTPAAQMFREDAERSFVQRARRVRLLHRGEIGAAAAVLRLDVDGFEVRYDSVAAAPTVIVSLRATLSRPDGEGLQQRAFAVHRGASENRVSAIVAAFDAATAQALEQTVAWTDVAAPEPPPSLSETTTTTSSTTTTASPR